MGDSDKELEVKFYISKPREIASKLLTQGGTLKEGRVHEINLRLDTPEMSLMKAGSILRIRQDNRARVTYKGMGRIEGGVSLRQELEFTVSNFETARKLFEALGYQVYLIYEKYRTTYELDALEIVIDELPFGDFMEIEGSDGAHIQSVAQQLDLDWDARILYSYTVLFEHARERLGYDFRDLSFNNFKGMTVTPEVLGVLIADSS